MVCRKGRILSIMTSVVHNLPEQFGNVIARNTYQAIIIFFNFPLSDSRLFTACGRVCDSHPLPNPFLGYDIIITAFRGFGS